MEFVKKYGPAFAVGAVVGGAVVGFGLAKKAKDFILGPGTSAPAAQ